MKSLACLLYALPVGIVLFVPSAAVVQAEQPTISFNRDIRPILSDKCFACHGPDAAQRQADLRFDDEQVAKSELDSGATAVVPGDIQSSALIERITADDPDTRMPPADSGKSPLTDQQVQLVRQWIAQGAPWEGHWSFLPIGRPQPPVLDDPQQFITNGIDAFTLAQMRDQGLTPSPEADPVTLIRRLSFDLTGLPPTAEEVRQFQDELRSDPKAYEQLVDRLLNSPHYGERMAMFWLDLVRYADSVGYHGDQPISVSPYRDYVIASFNRNQRFDQFTIEQLAGDLLPDPTRDQQIASGYNRLGMMSAEGGVQDKEYLAKYISERVRNASGTWLGVTMGCCECHDHKFDPFTAKDFYRFEAFFADISERGLYSGAHASGAWGPSIQVPDAAQAAQQQQLQSQIGEVQQQLATTTPALAEAQQQWEASLAESQVPWTALQPSAVTSQGGAALTVRDDHSILAAGDKPEKDTYIIQTAVPPGMTALRIDVLPHESLPKQGPGRAANGNFVLTEVELQVVSGDQPARQLSLNHATATVEQTQSAEKNPHKAWTAASAIDADAQGDGWGWAILDEAGRENHAVFRLAEPLTEPAGATLTITLKQQHGNGSHTLGRFRLSATSSEKPAVAFGTGLPRDVRDALAVVDDQRSPEQRKYLADYYRGIAPQLEPARARLADLQKQLDALNKQITTTLVTKAVEPRMIRVLPRGNWMDDSGEVVQPGVPHFLPQPVDNGRPLTRLDLANWMVSPDNPLTARAMANRLWSLYFGNGIARKLDDLGAQGQWPTHPQLLDWLAGQFIDSGWDVKHTIKLIVMSSTYRQSSIPTETLREQDPYNLWLARQSRFRLPAEMVRDTMLAVSGLLVDDLGGPSVHPYQPPGYWSHLNFPKREWQNDDGAALYRRGLYTHWQRQYLHPSLLAFDAPSREECTAERIRSNTPLQALVLLNDPSYVEAARVFAERVVRDGGSTVDERLDWAFQRTLSRSFRENERQVIVPLLEQHLAQYQREPQAAAELLAVGNKPAATDLDAVQVAAWTSVTRLLLNLHETITRR